MLCDFAKLNSDEFARRFQKAEDFPGEINKIIEVKPELFGIALNVNELLSRCRRRFHDGAVQG